jgi:hypothetical protein
MWWILRHPCQAFQALLLGVAEQRHLDCQMRAAGIRDQLADDIGRDQ